MAFQRLDAEIAILAKDLTGEAFRQVEQKLNASNAKMSTSFDSLKNSALKAFGIIGGAAMIREAVRSYGRVEDQLGRLNRAFGLTGDQARRFGEALKDSARSSLTGMEEMIASVEAARDLLSVTPSQARHYAELGGKVANLMGKDAATTTRVMSALFNTFGIAEKDADQATANFQKTLSETGAEVESFGGRGLRAARALREAFGPGTEGLTRYMAAFDKLKDTIGDSRSVVAGLDDIAESMADPSKIIKELYPGMKQAQTELFGDAWRKRIQQAADPVGAFVGMVETRMKELGLNIQSDMDLRKIFKTEGGAAAFKTLWDLEQPGAWQKQMEKNTQTSEQFFKAFDEWSRSAPGRQKAFSDEWKNTTDEIGKTAMALDSFIGKLTQDTQGSALHSAAEDLRAIQKSLDMLMEGKYMELLERFMYGTDKQGNINKVPKGRVSFPLPGAQHSTLTIPYQSWMPKEWEGTGGVTVLPPGNYPKSAPPAGGPPMSRAPWATKPQGGSMDRLRSAIKKADYRGEVLPFTRSDSGAITMSMPNKLVKLNDYIKRVYQGLTDPAAPENQEMNLALAALMGTSSFPPYSGQSGFFAPDAAGAIPLLGGTFGRTGPRVGPYAGGGGHGGTRRNAYPAPLPGYIQASTGSASQVASREVPSLLQKANYTEDQMLWELQQIKSALTGERGVGGRGGYFQGYEPAGGVNPPGYVPGFGPAGGAGGYGGSGSRSGGRGGRIPNYRGGSLGPATGGVLGGKTAAEREAAYREIAKARGIDPDKFVETAKREGLNWRGQWGGGMDRGTSFGDFQLHRGGPGSVGYEYEKLYGPMKPEDWRQMGEFAANWIAEHGYDAWTSMRGTPWRRGHPVPVSKVAPMEPNTKETANTQGESEGEKLLGWKPAAIILHHTAGGGTPEQVAAGMARAGRGVQFIQGRNGEMYYTGVGRGGAHMKTSTRKPIAVSGDLSNQTTAGIEVIAADETDVTPEQIQAQVEFFQKMFPNTPVYGHGEVNYGKRALEGVAGAEAIRASRAGRSAGGVSGESRARQRASGSYPGAGAPIRQKVELQYTSTPDANQFARKERRNEVNRMARNAMFDAHADIQGA